MGTQVKKSQSIWQHIRGYLFILPMLILVFGFIYYGIIDNIITSFYKWNGVSPHMKFIGLKNYVNLFQDGDFWHSLSNTFIFMVLTVVIQAAIGLFLAVLLHIPGRGRGIMKTVFFFPVVISIVVSSVVFSQIYEYNFGLLNEVLRAIHLGGLAQQWLGDPKFAIYATISVNIFQWMGSSMIMYYTAMLTIPGEVFEAALLDGAGFWRTLGSIIFPLVKGTHFTLSILGVIGALKTFDVVWMMTQGGPGTSSEVISTFLFRKTMLDQEAGYASAVAVILLIIALLITAIQMYINKRTESR